MTTPEQLAKWREDANKLWGTKSPKYGTAYQFYIEGYLRAKRENEQAIKDARKQALEDALKLAEDHHLDLDGSEYHRGWRNASIRCANQIKELLK